MEVLARGALRNPQAAISRNADSPAGPVAEAGYDFRCLPDI
jgi:hypothetical protein